MAVLTRQKNLEKIKDVIYFNNPVDLLEYDWKDRDIWICGGGDIYNLMLNVAEELYITLVDTEIEPGIKFPCIPELTWEIVNVELGGKEKDLIYNYMTYRKRK